MELICLFKLEGTINMHTQILTRFDLWWQEAKIYIQYTPLSSLGPYLCLTFI